MSSSYRDFVVWQRAKELAVGVVRVTQSFPRTELYALGSQLRRAAVSVPSNIAEGQERLTRGEFRQFLGNARGSLLEVSTQLEIACELGYVDCESWKHLAEKTSEVLFLLNRLIQAIQTTRRQSSETSETIETSETRFGRKVPEC